MQVLKVPLKQLRDEVIRHISGGIHRSGYALVDTPIAIVYRKTQVDEEECRKRGYTIYELQSNGGTVLCNPGDLAIGNIGRISSGWCDRFIAYFVSWLKSRGLNADSDKNDVLVEGYKVCGMCVNRCGRVDYSYGFIGVNTKLDDIRVICRKPMTKIPRGLSDWGVTTEDVEQMFIDFCEKDREEFL